MIIVSNLSVSQFFRIEGHLADENIQYYSGTGAPDGTDTLLMAATKGSFYTDKASGVTYKKKGTAGVALDWSRQLDEQDYSTIATLIDAGGSANTALQNEVDTLETTLGVGADGTLGNVFAATNYIAAQASVVNAIKTLDGRAKTTVDALATETTRATNAEDATNTALAAEIQNRIDADTAAAATAADELNTETQARIAGDLALNGRADDIQAELNATQVGAGLDIDGAYTAASGDSLIGTAVSLKDADLKLATAVRDETSRATGVEGALASAIANETQRAQDAETALEATIQSWVSTQIALDNTTDEARVAAEAALRIAKDNDLQAELDATQAAVGLATDGTVIPITGTNYLDAATTVFGGAFILDTELKRVDDGLTAEITNRTNAVAAVQTGLNAETQNRQDAVTALQGELNTTQAGAGLETNGAYAAPTGSNYLGAATSLKDADFILDAAVKVVSDAVAAETTARTTAVTNEANARAAADTTLTNSITAETSRAVAAEGVLTAAVTLLDQKQTETAALLLSARKESSATNISAASVVDEIATQQTDACKWTVYAKGTGADAQKRVVMEVLAMHNGTDTIDADAIDQTSYAKLKLGTLLGLVVSVELSGVGAAQRMQLKVASPTTSVDVYAVRERLPGIDLGTTQGGGAGAGNDDSNWTPGDTDFIFGSESYTPNPNIVF
ncbi:MAG: hypothetical protein ABW007_02980 [Chitinophagaceae bacterium]